MIEPKIEIILYVKNQERSKEFYALLFGKDPVLDVPGMVEFQVSDDFKLGLMLETSIVKIIEDRLPHPNLGNGIPRCELYFKVDDVVKMFDLALFAGAKSISENSARDWGDDVAYVADLDGHVIAFSKICPVLNNRYRFWTKLIFYSIPAMTSLLVFFVL